MCAGAGGGGGGAGRLLCDSNVCGAVSVWCRLRHIGVKGERPDPVALRPRPSYLSNFRAAQEARRAALQGVWGGGATGELPALEKKDATTCSNHQSAP